jgi:7TM diverse intracellular signalling/7TMR-DISM extracellular 2
MKLIYLFAILTFLPIMATTQSVYTLTDKDTVSVKNFAILADNKYNFEQILSDSTLQFTPVDSLKPYETEVYWVKWLVQNPFAYAEKMRVSFYPYIDNTLFYYDYNQNKWIEKTNGLIVNNQQHSVHALPLILQGHQLNVVYFKVSVKVLKQFPHKISPYILLAKAAYVDKKIQFLDSITGITVAIVLMFFLYNAYIYYVFKDKTYLYYLIIQIGGMGYMLTNNQYMNVLIPYRFDVFHLDAKGNVFTYDLNFALNRIAVLFVLGGFIQFTRVYLTTQTALPKLDKMLKYLLVACILTYFLGVFLIISEIKFVDAESVLISNILVVVTIFTILYTAVVRYRQHYKPARFFLFANSLPLAIILALGVSRLISPSGQSPLSNQIASIALVAQAFGLALALAERLLLIRSELKQKQLEAQELAYHNERILTENLLQKTQNDLLQEKLTSNQRELTSTTLYTTQRNELLTDLKVHVQVLSRSVPNSAKTVIDSIETLIQSNMNLDSDWERFKIHFEQVHPNFFDNLQAQYPTLTKNELRLSAYFHLNLSTKEIAALLNIDPASVRTAKMRLNKKMNEEVKSEK